MVGVWVVRCAGIASALFAFSLVLTAKAQSTASFPEPAGSPPPRVTPQPVAPPPSYLPAPPAPVRPYTPPLPIQPQPQPNALDNRYPVLARSAPLPSPVSPPMAPGELSYAPPVLPYEAGMAVPPGYHSEYRYANGLIVGGTLTVGVAYAAGLLGASGGNGLGWLSVPVIGPWGAMASRKFSCANDPLQAQACVNKASHEVRTMALLSADAVVQATGAVLFFVGLGSGHYELVRNDQVSIRLTPRPVADGGLGFALSGQF